MNRNVVKTIKTDWVGSRTVVSTLQEGTIPDACAEINTDDSRDPEVLKKPYDRSEWVYSPQGLLAMWKGMVYTDSLCEFEETWRKLQEIFGPTQSKLVDYLNKTYYSVSEDWAFCNIGHHRHYGIVTTSRAESLHAQLRHILIHPMTSNLLQVVQSCYTLTASSHKSLLDRLSWETTTARDVWRRCPLLIFVVEKLSHKALKMIWGMYQYSVHHVLGWDLPINQPFCTSRYRTNLGLPYYHKLCKDFIEGTFNTETGAVDVKVKRYLRLHDIDPQWHLPIDLAIIEPLRNVRDPPLRPPRSRQRTAPTNLLLPPGAAVRPRPQPAAASQAIPAPGAVVSVRPARGRGAGRGRGPRSARGGARSGGRRGGSSRGDPSRGGPSRGDDRDTRVPVPPQIVNADRLHLTLTPGEVTAARLLGAVARDGQYPDSPETFMGTSESLGVQRQRQETPMPFIQSQPPISRAQQRRITEIQRSSSRQSQSEHIASQRLPSSWEDGIIRRGHGGPAATAVEAPRAFDNLPEDFPLTQGTISSQLYDDE